MIPYYIVYKMGASLPVTNVVVDETTLTRLRVTQDSSRSCDETALTRSTNLPIVHEWEYIIATVLGLR